MATLFSDDSMVLTSKQNDLYETDMNERDSARVRTIYPKLVHYYL